MDSKGPRIGHEARPEKFVGTDDFSPKSSLSAQSAHADPVDVFFAGEPSATRAIRRSINRCNAASAIRAARSNCEDARGLFWLTAQLAGCWTFRPANHDSLKDARQALRYLFLAASMIEQLETPDGH